MVDLGNECSVCYRVSSHNPVDCKVISKEVGIWQIMIWALAQAGNR